MLNRKSLLTFRLFAIATGVCAPLCYGGSITDAWLGGSGSWSNSADWSAGVPNNNPPTTYAVTIGSGGTDQVTLDISPTVDSLTLGGATGSASLQTGTGSQTLQIVGGLTVNSTASMVLANGSSLTAGADITNGGTIQVVGSGTSLSTSGNLNTSGVLAIGDGFGSAAVLNVTGNLNNSGNSGDYNFQVLSGATANVGSLTNSGSLYVAGTLNLTGGGSGVTDIVAGSQIRTTTGAAFNVINNGVSTNALANLASVEGTLVLGTGQNLTLASLNNSGTVQVVNPDTSLTVTGNLATSGTLAIGDGFGSAAVLNVTGNLNNSGGSGDYNFQVLGGATANVGSLTNTGSLYVAGTLNLTGGGQGVTDIVAGSQIRTNTGAALNVINNGVSTNALANLASVEGALVLGTGQNLTLASLTNSGTVQVVNPGTSLTVTGNLATSGTLAVGDGFGSAATLNVAGNLNNSGNSGDYNFQVLGGATANVGSLTNTGSLYVAGTLNLTGGGAGVTTVVAGSSIQLGGSGTFNVINNGVSTNALANLTLIDGNSTAGGGRLVLGNGQTLALGSLTNLGDFQVVDPGSAVTLTGNFTNGSLTYSGAVGIGDGFGDFDSLTVADEFLNEANSTFDIASGAIASVGLLANQASSFSNLDDGFVSVNGTLCAGSIENAGVIEVGSTGSINGSGCSNETTTGITETIFSSTEFGQLDFSGAANIGGVLDVDLEGFVPAVGESFDFIQFAPGGLEGSFTGIEDDLFNNGTEQWVLTYDNADGEVLLTAEAAQSSSTPEPSTMLLIGSGLFGIGCWTRMRRQRESVFRQSRVCKRPRQ